MFLCAALAGRGGGRFELSVTKRVLPEMGTVTRCLLSTEKGTYGFMPPHSWRIEVDSGEKRVNMTSQDSTLITIRSLDDAAGSGGSKSAEWMRDLVMNRYPDGKIVEDFACFTEGAAGRAFDIELNTSIGTKLLSRLVFVPINGETIEFHLTAHTSTFRSDAVTLSSLLTSFELAPAGDKTR